MASLCHPWFSTTNLSYRFPIFETSATALCGTTGIDINGVQYGEYPWISNSWPARMNLTKNCRHSWLWGLDFKCGTMIIGVIAGTSTENHGSLAWNKIPLWFSVAELCPIFPATRPWLACYNCLSQVSAAALFTGLIWLGSAQESTAGCKLCHAHFAAV